MMYSMEYLTSSSLLFELIEFDGVVTTDGSFSFFAVASTFLVVDFASLDFVSFDLPELDMIV